MYLVGLVIVLLALGMIAFGVLVGIGLSSARENGWASFLRAALQQYAFQRGLLPTYPMSWLSDPMSWLPKESPCHWCSLGDHGLTRPALLLGAAALAGGANRVR